MKMRRNLSLLLLLCAGGCFSLGLGAQTPFRVMSYNVENLFDCQDDSLKDDAEFLPDAERQWTYQRYQTKLNNIAQVIKDASAEVSNPPALVGLCEVENEHCLYDLTTYSALKSLSYRFVMTNSPDKRGIDVALLYQPTEFRVLQTEHIRVAFSARNPYPPTRDILHVTGEVRSGDTLDVYVAHWPSRSGGEMESQPARVRVADILHRSVQETLHSRKCPQVVIMGDFNDYPDNFSVTRVLKAKAPKGDIKPDALYHLFARKAAEGSSGSYRYQGQWGFLDHLIVSGNLLNKQAGMYTDESLAHVLRLPYLLKEDKKYGGDQPSRTYAGPYYLGGYSDHLPVYMDLMPVQK